MKTKPQTFNITGKSHQLQSFEKDLKDLGYNDWNSEYIFHHMGICCNPIKWDSDLIQLARIEDKCKDKTFTLPDQYSEALQFCKEQLEVAKEYFKKEELELVDGKWYYLSPYDSNTILKYKTSNNDLYTEIYLGVETYPSLVKKIYENSSIPTLKKHIKRLATKEEILKALTYIAEQKGFKEGCKYKVNGHTFVAKGKLALWGWTTDLLINDPELGLHFNGAIANGLIYDGTTNTWAELIKKEEFKVGDRVRIIENKANSLNEVGDIGIIEKDIDSGYKVKVIDRDQESNYQRESDLELIKEEKFKVGDWVKFDVKKAKGSSSYTECWNYPHILQINYLRGIRDNCFEFIIDNFLLANNFKPTNSSMSNYKDCFIKATDEEVKTELKRREQSKCPTELTLQEIADKFNIPVKQLRIKDK